MLTKTQPTTRARVRAQRASTTLSREDEAEERPRLPNIVRKRRKKKRSKTISEIREATPPLDESEERLLSKSEVICVTGRSYVTLWQWMRQNKFPRARFAEGRTVWLKSEIDHWLRNLPIRPLKGDV